MQASETHTVSEPWYRYSQVWLLILLPLSVVVASFITIAIVVQNAPEVMVEGKPQYEQSHR